MIGRVWKPLLVVAGLLLLLTYLLLQSRSSDPALRARMHDALHAFELHDAQLNRDVLRVRAGLLVHYDSLSQAIGGLYGALESLQWREAAVPRRRGILANRLQIWPRRCNRKKPYWSISRRTTPCYRTR